MNNMKGEYPFISYNIQHELKMIKEDDLLVCELFGYTNPNQITIEICGSIYDACIESYAKTINDIFNEKIGELMVSKSISQGEALMVVENVFEKQVGFLTLFFRCFFMMVPYCRSVVNNILNEG